MVCDELGLMWATASYGSASLCTLYCLLPCLLTVQMWYFSLIATLTRPIDYHARSPPNPGADWPLQLPAAWIISKRMKKAAFENWLGNADCMEQNGSAWKNSCSCHGNNNSNSRKRTKQFCVLQSYVRKAISWSVLLNYETTKPTAFSVYVIVLQCMQHAYVHWAQCRPMYVIWLLGYHSWCWTVFVL